MSDEEVGLDESVSKMMGVLEKDGLLGEGEGFESPSKISPLKQGESEALETEQLEGSEEKPVEAKLEPE